MCMAVPPKSFARASASAYPARRPSRSHRQQNRGLGRKLSNLLTFVRRAHAGGAEIGNCRRHPRTVGDADLGDRKLTQIADLEQRSAQAVVWNRRLVACQAHSLRPHRHPDRVRVGLDRRGNTKRPPACLQRCGGRGRRGLRKRHVPDEIRDPARRRPLVNVRREPTCMSLPIHYSHTTGDDHRLLRSSVTIPKSYRAGAAYHQLEPRDLALFLVDDARRRAEQARTLDRARASATR